MGKSSFRLVHGGNVVHGPNSIDGKTLEGMGVARVPIVYAVPLKVQQQQDDVQSEKRAKDAPKKRKAKTKKIYPVAEYVLVQSQHRLDR